MGGKGASQDEMSWLVTEFNLKGVDVPKGFGLSTRVFSNGDGASSAQRTGASNSSTNSRPKP